MSTGVGGSGARPCDACVEQRAQWYCSADDAYLCSTCDTKVHTANSIASRHERVRLTTTTSAVRFPGDHLACLSSSWLRKRSRSDRRHGRSNPGGQKPLVSTRRTDEPLSWLCNHPAKSEPREVVDCVKTDLEPKRLLDLNFDFCLENEREMEKPKIQEEERKFHLQLNYEEVLSAWSDRGSPWAQAHSIMYTLDDTTSDLEEDEAGLEFGLVPNFASLGCGQPSGREQAPGQVPVMIHGGDGQRPRAGGREACVMRYREKRRSRLFYKRIRYHVRKLNAENRPRMKGRFVKGRADETESLPL